METLLLSLRWTARLQAQAPEEAPATGREKENDTEERRAGQQIADDYRLPWRTGQQDGDATGEAQQKRSGRAEALRSCPVPSPPGPAPACSACSRSQAMQRKPPLLNKHLWANKKPKTGGKGWDWGCSILLGSAWQAAGARLLVLHLCATTQGFSRREKRTERCAGLPIFLFYFSFSMGCLLSFTKELQSKGTDTEDLGIIESHRVKTEIAEVFDAVRHETESLLLMKSKWEMLRLGADFETNSQKLQ